MSVVLLVVPFAVLFAVPLVALVAVLPVLLLDVAVLALLGDLGRGLTGRAHAPRAKMTDEPPRRS